MKQSIIKEIPFYQFPHLADHPFVWHGIFTRHGGCSGDPYRSLNVSFGLGDSPNRVQRNRTLISRSIGQKNIVYINQNHGTGILILNRPGGTPFAKQTADSMITDIPETLLAVQVADCQALLLYDPVRRVVANVHSGWRGSIRNIVGRTVTAMKTGFDCDPTSIRVGIGPSLGPCCAEFRNYRTEIPEPFWAYKDERNCFDFWAISVDQLREAGIPGRQIALSRVCTRCRKDLFYSYRGERITGRFAAIIGLTGAAG